MKKVINVTATDIEHGEAGECHTCPVALAIRRMFKAVSCIEVFPTSAEVSFVKDGVLLKTLYAVLPESVAVFIGKFDCNQKVKPFKFTADFKQTYPVA